LAADFFQQQDTARRSTTRLAVLFALAVVAIIASIELLLAATMGYVGRNPDTGAVDWTAATDPQLLVVSVVGTLIIVIGGSLYKIAALRAGGSVVAEQLGGRRLAAGTSSDPVEQRLLNVVEEMAIASGTPTPPVYLLDGEDGINAFAAGFTASDAVIGITRGAATRLSRDELQGVIAHEFSHILNGDMRMDMRLMGLLHGILIIGMLGYFILRMSFYTGGGRRRGGKDGVPILALGAGLAVIGFAGTFFGNLIKAAISRQREFLADASAVQFTRHPDGIAGALKKIGGFVGGSAIENPNAPEASHMFFGRATSGWTSMFSTHPPIAERIRRIDPSWDGEFPASVPLTDAARAPVTGSGVVGFAGAAAAGPPAAGAVASIGQPGPAHIQYAARLIAGLPPALLAAARDPYGARAVVYALLLDRAGSVRQQQYSYLQAGADSGALEETRRLLTLTESLDAKARLPLVEIALPALRALTANQAEAFTNTVAALVEADHTIDLFEWSLQHILLRDLDRQHDAGRQSRVRFGTVADVRLQCELLLSTLAYVGQRQPGAAADAFEQARLALDLADARLQPQEDCQLDHLDAALGDLDEAAPQVKRQILQAAVACITADRQVTAAEAELLRAVSASMSCPMPPLMLD
jgi:Zn-dependent protease with chaperone function